MNIYKYEVKSGLKSSVIRAIVLSVVLIFLLTMYPTFSSQIGGFQDLLKSYPPEFLRAFGINLNNLGSVIGFYSFTGLYLGLVAGKQASTLGYTTFSKETREKVSDFLLTKPVSRTKIITSKLLAVISLLVITNIIYMTVASVSLLIVSKGTLDLALMFALHITLFLLQLMILIICVFVGVLFPKIKSVEGITFGIIGAFYIIKMLEGILNEDKLKYLSPYGYFDFNDVFFKGAINIKMCVIASIICVVLIIFSYIIYQKKDIESV